MKNKSLLAILGVITILAIATACQNKKEDPKPAPEDPLKEYTIDPQVKFLAFNDAQLAASKDIEDQFNPSSAPEVDSTMPVGSESLLVSVFKSPNRILKQLEISTLLSVDSSKASVGIDNVASLDGKTSNSKWTKLCLVKNSSVTIGGLVTGQKIPSCEQDTKTVVTGDIAALQNFEVCGLKTGTNKSLGSTTEYGFAKFAKSDETVIARRTIQIQEGIILCANNSLDGTNGREVGKGRVTLIEIHSPKIRTSSQPFKGAISALLDQTIIQLESGDSVQTTRREILK